MRKPINWTYTWDELKFTQTNTSLLIVKSDQNKN